MPQPVPTVSLSPVPSPFSVRSAPASVSHALALLQPATSLMAVPVDFTSTTPPTRALPTALMASMKMQVGTVNHAKKDVSSVMDQVLLPVLNVVLTPQTLKSIIRELVMTYALWNVQLESMN